MNATDPSKRVAPPAGSPAACFAVLWEEIAELMGSAAAATLLRRAAKRARERAPELAELSIDRDLFEYRYEVPPSWMATPSSASSHALHELVRELRPLLLELTGPVVLRRLRAIPALDPYKHLLEGAP